MRQVDYARHGVTAEQAGQPCRADAGFQIESPVMRPARQITMITPMYESSACRPL